MKKRKLLKLLGVTLITIVILIIAVFGIFYKQLIYPPLHRFIPSPRLLLPEAASSSIDIVEHGDRSKPYIAITFDADMTPGMLALLKTGVVKSLYNAEIKKILDDTHTKATVFLGGLWTETYPTQAKALADDPLIEIGNHSFNHYAFANGCYELPLIQEPAEDDVRRAQNVIYNITGVTPQYFRFPGGCYSQSPLSSIVALGLTVVHWDIASDDGFNNNTDSIVQNVESHVQNGSILVFHIHDSTYAPKTADAIAKIIPDLKARGFVFVKVSELIHP